MRKSQGHKAERKNREDELRNECEVAKQTNDCAHVIISLRSGKAQQDSASERW